MTIEDEMARHETDRWHLNMLVEDAISAAYAGGYEPEIKAFTDEELAEDLWCYCEPFYDYTVEQITQAVKEFRNVQ